MTLTVQPPRPRRQPDVSDRLNWPMIVGALLLLSFLGRAGRGGGGRWGFLPWLILGNMMGGRGSFGGRSSGGFGGYDSGDSFGGFGGGDSGGGGASSDW